MENKNYTEVDLCMIKIKGGNRIFHKAFTFIKSYLNVFCKSKFLYLQKM